MGHADDQVLQETIPQIYTNWVEESRRTLYEGNDWQQNCSIDRPPQRAVLFFNGLVKYLLVRKSESIVQRQSHLDFSTI